MNIPFVPVSGAPSSGQINISPYGGVSNGPGPGSGISFPFPSDFASRPNNTQGWFWAQETVPHHYIAMHDERDPDTATFAKNLGPGMLVLSRCTNRIPSEGTAPHYSVPENSNTAQLMEVTQLNQWLEKKSHLYKNADQIMREWKLLGVIKVEVAPNSQSNYGRRAPGRMMNLIVGHRVSLLNIFGKDIVDGMKLFIIVKKCKCRSVAKRHRDGGEREASCMRWRLLPYAHKNNQKPPLQALKYMEKRADDGKEITKYGSYYYVGKSGESLGGQSPNLYGDNGNCDEASEFNMRLFQNNMTDGSMEVYLGI
jgi:hypothetical protein